MTDKEIVPSISNVKPAKSQNGTLMSFLAHVGPAQWVTGPFSSVLVLRQWHAKQTGARPLARAPASADAYLFKHSPCCEQLPVLETQLSRESKQAGIGPAGARRVFCAGEVGSTAAVVL